MAEENEDGQEKTEEPSEERREKFREKGDIAVSKELTSVFVLGSTIIFLSYYFPILSQSLQDYLKNSFRGISYIRISETNFVEYFISVWKTFLSIIIPIFLITTVIATLVTFAQTKFNISLSKLTFNFSRINPLSGFKRIFSSQAILELFKSMGKMIIVGSVSYIIITSSSQEVVALINLNIVQSWIFWAELTQYLFFGITILLFTIAGVDYAYNFRATERKMKMTKQEVKDEHKQREVDPLIKNKLRALQRELINKKTMAATKKATVVITNPTHYSVAVLYEYGMPAPLVIAKGKDLVALKMREIAKEHDIPIVENKPVARALYDKIDINQEVPSNLYKVISEIIRYVFKLKGIKINKR